MYVQYVWLDVCMCTCTVRMCGYMCACGHVQYVWVDVCMCICTVCVGRRVYVHMYSMCGYMYVCAYFGMCVICSGSLIYDW